MSRGAIKQTKTPERREAGELEFLSRSAMAFLDFPQDGDLFALIADLLSDRLKNDAILAVSDYDEKAGLFRPRAIRGLETMLEATKKILGQDPMNLAGDFGPAAKKALASGKFQKVESNLGDFTNKLLPGPVAKAIEKLLGLSGFYVVGFEKEGKIKGGLSIVTRKQTVLPEAAVLEAFAGQAAVALERKRAQESHRETESTLRVFLNSLPGPAILISREVLVLEANESMARRLTRSRAEIIGQRAFALLPPEIAEGRIGRFQTVLKTGRPEIFEDSRAGVFYMNYMFPVLDEKNEVSKVSVFAFDITERVRAEETVRMQRDLAIALGATTSLGEALKLFLKAAITAGRMDSGGIYLIDLAAGAFDIVYHEGLSSEFVKLVSHYEPDTPHARLAREGKSCYLPAKEFDPAIAAPLIREGLRVLAVVPVRHEGQIIACLNVASHTLEDVPAYARVPLEMIAAQIGSAIARRQTEDALRASEERYQELVETANEAIVVAQEEMLKFANPKASEITGYSRDELIKMPFLKLIHSDDRQMVADRHLKRLAGEEPPEKYPFRIIDKEGHIKWVEINAVAMNWEGKPATLNILDDITERRRAEEALRKSEERLREAQALGKIGSWEFDIATRKIEWSDEVYALYERDKALGPPSAEEEAHYYPPEEAGRLREYARLATEKGEEFRYDLEARLPRGRTVFFNASMRPIKNDEGRVIKLFGTVQDITERKKTEKTLRENQETISAIVESSQDWIWTIDLAGRHTYSNRALEKILGYSPAEFQGMGLDLVHPEDRRVVDALWPAWIEARQGWQNLVLRWRTKDGTYRYLESTAVPILGSRGELLGFRGVDRDITERKKAEEGLRQSADRLRRTLKAAINSLSSAIEMRDPYTAGHQEQVTKLAVAIAREMGLSEDSIEALQIAGMVHDIGKLSVPAEILSKPTRLTEIEFSLIQTHPEIGYTILSKIDFPWPIARIVGQHHERVDGSGYPHGLPGKELLTESKILSVADTVEAMSSHRPYRPALGIEAALGEIKAKRGILYDPEVVDACVRIFAENKYRI